MFSCLHVKDRDMSWGKETTTAMTQKCFLFIGEAVTSGEIIRKSMTRFRMPITCTRTVAVEFLFKVWMILSKPNPHFGKFRWQ